MDTDLHSEHTPHTELSLSATQTLLAITHTASCYGHSHKREQSWDLALFSVQSIKSNQSVGTSLSNCLRF